MNLPEWFTLFSARFVFFFIILCGAYISLSMICALYFIITYKLQRSGFYFLQQKKPDLVKWKFERVDSESGLCWLYHVEKKGWHCVLSLPKGIKQMREFRQKDLWNV